MNSVAGLSGAPILQRGESMELEYERDMISGFECLADTCLCQEETLESIVPDACPDILRIVDVCGQAVLLSRQAEDGMAVVNGLVKAVILYQPEGENGLRRMEASIPFICRTEVSGLNPQGIVLASPRLRSAEARALNPRKVLLRVDLAVHIAACQPVQHPVVRSIAQQEHICQRQFIGEHDHLFSVQEKPFTLTETARLQPGQVGACQVMAGRCRAECTESKVIGTKLIFKGAVHAELILQEESGALTVYRESFPVSQVLDVNGGGEDNVCAITVEVTDFQWDGMVGEDRIIAFTFDLLAQARIYERRPVILLQDVYSTSNGMEAVWEPFHLHRMEKSIPRTQPVRGLLETPEGVRGVIDSRLVLGPVACVRSAEGLQLTTQAHIAVLYLDEHSQVRGITKTLPVQCSFSPQEEGECRCFCGETTDLYAAPTAGGIEVRFSVEFQCSFDESREVNMVVRAKMGEKRKKDRRSPSVVLRLAAPEEELWDLAKAYQTTMEAIRQANGLEDERLPTGRMLLIPGCR